jgi:hypothetical protein
MENIIGSWVVEFGDQRKEASCKQNCKITSLHVALKPEAALEPQCISGLGGDGLGL